jgi:hypothetical protein
LKYYTSKKFPDASSWDVENNLKPIDPVISTDLPYNQYQKLKKEQQITREYKNGEYSAGWNFFNIIGTSAADVICDTCNINNQHKDTPQKPLSCISLPGWKLRSTTADRPILDSVIFHVQNGQAYLRKSVISSKTINKAIVYKEEIKDVPVKFRYSHKSQMLKIPVSESLTNAVTIITQIVTALLVLISFYAALMFTKLIINLRDGSEFGTVSLVYLWLLCFLFFLFSLCLAY